MTAVTAFLLFMLTNRGTLIYGAEEQNQSRIGNDRRALSLDNSSLDPMIKAVSENNMTRAKAFILDWHLRIKRHTEASLERKNMRSRFGYFINQKDEHGRPLMQIATENQNIPMMDLLIKNGAGTNCRDEAGFTLLDKLLMSQEKVDQKVVLMLQNNGGTYKPRSLLAALKNNNAAIVIPFMNNMRASDKPRFLQYLYNENEVETITTVLETNKDLLHVPLNSLQQTIWHLAVQHDKTRLLTHLQRNFSDKSDVSKDMFGATPKALMNERNELLSFGNALEYIRENSPKEVDKYTRIICEALLNAAAIEWK